MTLLSLTAAGAWLGRVELGRLVYAQAVDAAFGRDATASLPDGLHVILCGTGSPLPDPDRSGPCTLVIAGKRVFLVDAGPGAGRRIGEIGVPLGRIDAVLLTHFHSDHIDGLGEVTLLRWAGGGRSAPLPIHGPIGVDQVVGGLRAAYAADTTYRIAHHGADVMPPAGAGGAALPFSLEATHARGSSTMPMAFWSRRFASDTTR